jgi:histidinol-phosphate/aromatic aminotransferase/cobyric acid decarboxylase-like protein
VSAELEDLQRQVDALTRQRDEALDMLEVLYDAASAFRAAVVVTTCEVCVPPHHIAAMPSDAVTIALCDAVDNSDFARAQAEQNRAAARQVAEEWTATRIAEWINSHADFLHEKHARSRFANDVGEILREVAAATRAGVWRKP